MHLRDAEEPVAVTWASEAIGRGRIMIAVVRFPIARKTPVSSKCVCAMRKIRWP